MQYVQRHSAEARAHGDKGREKQQHASAPQTHEVKTVLHLKRLVIHILFLQQAHYFELAIQTILKGFSPSSVSTNPLGSAVAEETEFCFNSMFI